MEMITRGQYTRLYNSGKIDTNQIVKVFHIPVGLHCRLYEENKSIVLTNGIFEYVDQPLCLELWQSGIKGDFIISAPKISPDNISSWLNIAIEQQRNLSQEIIISIPVRDTKPLTQMPADLMYRIVMLFPVTMLLNDVHYDSSSFTRSVEYDGRLFDLTVDDVDYRVHLVPFRVAKGTVIYADNERRFIIVRLIHNNKDHVVKISRFYGAGKDISYMPGDKITMKYSIYLDGHRICNFINSVCVGLTK